MKKLDEEDLKLSMIEDINDVTKQRDMGSFYRHLYKEELCKNQNNDEIYKEKNSINKSDAIRQYRKRASSNSSDNNVNDDQDTDISDSDSSIDSSKRRKIKSHSEIKSKGEIVDMPQVKVEEKPLIIENSKEKSPNENLELKEKTKETAKYKKIEESKTKPKEIVPKINIWEKRTVGDIYESARQRYFERKMKLINLHVQS